MERGTPCILDGDTLRVAALAALKDDLLATLAHELRTPLTAMKGARALENLAGEAPPAAGVPPAGSPEHRPSQRIALSLAVPADLPLGFGERDG